MDGFLEFVNVDVVAVFAQAAIHDALEYKPHRLFESAGIGIEKSKIEVKLLLFEDHG